MNKKILILPLLILLTTACGQTIDDDDHSGDPTTSASSSSTTTSGDTSSTSTTTDTSSVDLVTKTVLTKGWDFGKGTQFNQESYPTANANLVSHFNTAFGAGVITSIECANVASQQYAVTSDTILSIGTKSDNGTMTLNFSKKVYSVKLEASNYYSGHKDTWTDPANPTVVMTLDEKSEIGVGISEATLNKINLNKSGDEPNKKTINLSFDGGTNKVVFKSYGCDKENEIYGRVFIYYLEFQIEK